MIFYYFLHKYLKFNVVNKKDKAFNKMIHCVGLEQQERGKLLVFNLNENNLNSTDE